MEKVKIAYYTTVDLSANDGPAVNETEFLKSLRDYSKNDFLFITSSQNSLFCQENNIKNVIYVPNFRFRFFFGFIILYLIKVIKIKRQQMDILVCRISDMPVIPFLYKLIYRKENLAIKTAALWYVDQKKPDTLSSKIYQMVNNYFTKKIYQLSDIVDTALPEAMHAFINSNIVAKNKIKLIDNGVNVDKFRIGTEVADIPDLKGRFPVLGFMGGYPSFRGARQALEVAKRLKSFYPNIAVIILGHDDTLEKLISAAKNDGVYIYAPGIVPYNSIEKYVQLMTIGFSFYEPSTVNFHGNASQKVRQYLACGKPVFSTYHNHQFLVENGIGSIFKGDDYTEMTEDALKWLLRIRDEKTVLENHIRKYAIDHLSSEYVFSQRIELYKQMVDGEKNDPNR